MNAITTTLTKLIENVPELLKQYEEEGYTIIHCDVYSAYKSFNFFYKMKTMWVTVDKSTCLYYNATKEKLELLNAINIPINPEKYWFKYFGERLAFTLIFPKIPVYWHSFDFRTNPDSISDVPKGHVVGGWYVTDIPRNNTGIYKLSL